MQEGRVVEEPGTPVRARDFIRVAGLRLVRPYYFDFICNIKDRWQGKSVIDVLHHEFPSQPRSHYEAAFADGRLRMEGAPPGAPASLPLQQGMRIRHYTHRHEPPVLDVPVPVLGMTEALVAVGKPPSLPVHASGQYRKNTVAAVLEAEYAHLGPLRPVHRLDKSVSGVLLFARSAAAANALGRRIEARAQRQSGQAHDVEKVYVARVCGAFPAEPVRVDLALAWNPRTNHVYAVPGGPLVAALVGDSALDPGTGAVTAVPGSEVASAAGDPVSQAVGADGGPSSGGSRAAGPHTPNGLHRHALPTADALVDRGVHRGDPASRSRWRDPADGRHGGELAQLRGDSMGGGQQGDTQSLAAARERRRAQRSAGRKQRLANKAAVCEAVAARVAAAAATAVATAAGVFNAAAAAKPALTEFRRLALAPDGRTSLVECRPRTGRTHQIRVHLQHLGHPIANDVQYGGPYPGPDQHRSWLVDAAPAVRDPGANPPIPGAGAAGAPARANGQHAAGDELGCGGGGSLSAAERHRGGAPKIAPGSGPSADEACGAAAPLPEACGNGTPAAASCADCSERESPAEAPDVAALAAVLAQASWSSGAPCAAAGSQAHDSAGGQCAAERLSSSREEAGLRSQEPGSAGRSCGAPLPLEVRKSRGLGDSDPNPNPGPGEVAAVQGGVSDTRGLLMELAGPLRDPLCIHCPGVALAGYPVPRPMWLHARRYACADWAFDCPLPAWAEPGYVPALADASVP